MKKMIYVSVALAAIFLSCKKSDEVTPAAATNTTIYTSRDTTIYTSQDTTINVTTTVMVPNGPVSRADLYPENGFISGVVNSKTSAGASFSTQFTHQLDIETATYYVNSNGHYVIHIAKGDKYGNVNNEDKRTDITFILKNDLTQIQSLQNLHTSIYVDSTATYITKFNVDQNASTSGMTVSNVTFDQTTGRLTANYSINVVNTYTSSAKNATIVGQIDTKLVNIRYRTAN